MVTVLATAASTYALDAFAVVVGALLAASGALAGLDRPLLLVVLGVTYAAWAAGMRVNLAANWSLLTCTGASTNALSMAAHDIARARHAGPRVRRCAASGGYVVCELAKEVPYYASAFGATLATDAVSGRDAVIFLAGTNLGAAVYEYGLARATGLFLRRRAPLRASAPERLPSGRPTRRATSFVEQPNRVEDAARSG
jgi:hypothetical protein